MIFLSKQNIFRGRQKAFEPQILNHCHENSTSTYIHLVNLLIFSNQIFCPFRKFLLFDSLVPTQTTKHFYKKSVLRTYKNTKITTIYYLVTEFSQSTTTLNTLSNLKTLLKLTPLCLIKEQMIGVMIDKIESDQQHPLFQSCAKK